MDLESQHQTLQACVLVPFLLLHMVFLHALGTWQLTAPDMHPPSLVALKERFISSSSNLDNSKESFSLGSREPPVAKGVWPYN